MRLKKTPRVSAKRLQKSLEHANISDYDTLNTKQEWCSGEDTTEEATVFLDSSQKSTWLFHSASGKIFCGQMKLQLSCLEGTHNTTLCVVKKKAQHTNIKKLIPTVKYGGGSIMVWGYFAASRPGQLAIIDGKRNSQVDQDILQENVRLSVCQLTLNRSWVTQQDNDPKHRSKSTTEEK